MGQCYNISMRVKFSNEKGAIEALNTMIKRGEEDHVNYGDISKYDLTNLDDIIKVFLVDHQGAMTIEVFPEGSKRYTSDFHCCYGWERVLLDMIQMLLWYVSEAEIYMDIDGGYHEFKKKDGQEEYKWHDWEDEDYDD